MLFDGIKLNEGSELRNATIASGAIFPDEPSIGELFYRTTDSTLYVYNGASWTQTGAGSASSIYDIGFSIEGKPSANTTIFSFAVPRAFSIPSSFFGSQALAVTAAAESSVFTISKNASSIGTLTFATGSAIGSFSGAGASFVAGDRLSITSPGTQDATLQNISITIVTEI